MDDGDVKDVVAAVRRLVRERVVPLEEQIDETDEMPAGLIEAAAEMGLYGFAIPEEYGGLGLSMQQEARLVMELGYTTPAFRSLFGTNNGIAGHVLLEGGTVDQRKEYLPRLAIGRVDGVVRADRGGGGLGPVRAADKRPPGGRRVCAQRQQALHHQRPRRRPVHGVRPARRAGRREPGTSRCS